MRKTVVYLFHAVLLLVPLFFSSKTDELFEFNKIILTYALAALILGAWLCRMILEKKIIFTRTPFDIPIAIFLGSQIISTLFSMHTRTSWFGYYSRFNGGLLSILTYVMLYYALVSNLKKEDIRPLLNTMLYGAFAAALYAIPEHFGHSFSCALIVKQFTVDCWIQDVQSRIFGTFGQPNWLAAYMLMMIPVSTAFMFENWKRPVRAAVYGVFTASFFLTILFTASRSGFFGLVVALAFGATVYFALLWPHNRALFKQSLVPAAGILLGLGILFQIYGAPFTPTLNAIVERVQRVTGLALPRKQITQEPTASPTSAPGTTTVPEQPVAPSGTQLDVGGTESGIIRSIVWKGAIAVWQSSPKYFWVGSGVETFAYSYYGQRLPEHNMVSEWDFLYNKAHNEFLNYLATTGILGFGSYVLMIGWVYVWIARRLWQKKQRNPALAVAWLVAYTGIHISNFLGFSTVVVSIIFYLLPAFILFELDIEDTRPEKKRQLQFTNTQAIKMGIVFIFTGWMLWSVLTWWRADRAYAVAKQYLQQQEAIPAIQSFQKAISLSPNEAVFHDEFANTLGTIAAGLAEQNDATQAAQFAQKALEEEDITITLNPVHLNFLKSRARLMIVLSAIEPQLLLEAVDTFSVARQLAPTDPKLPFNEAIVLGQLGRKDEAIELLQKALELKPDYGAAANKLKEFTVGSGAATPRGTMPVQ